MKNIDIINKLTYGIYFIDDYKHTHYGKYRLYDVNDVFKIGIKYGVYIRRVTIPFDDPDLRISINKKSDRPKIYANRVNIDLNYSISQLDNFKLLVDQMDDSYYAILYAIVRFIEIPYTSLKHYINFLNTYVVEKIEYIKYALEHNHTRLNDILLFACESGDAIIISTLIDKGADPTYRKCEAYKLAYRKKKMDIVGLLKKYDAMPKPHDIEIQREKSCIIM
jgi:hypothetical protein